MNKVCVREFDIDKSGSGNGGARELISDDLGDFLGGFTERFSKLKGDVGGEIAMAGVRDSDDWTDIHFKLFRDDLGDLR